MPTLYPVFEPSLSSAENFNGQSLSNNLAELDEIAVSLNLKILSNFIDARTMALEVLEEDQLPVNCPPVRWYSAQEGFATTQGLLLHLQKNPERLSQSRIALTADLEHLTALLEEAKNRSKFHLLIDL